jgi:REP element-mobilizing transposase RayT
MPTPPRLAFDTIYHIWNRGVNRCSIFLEEENYRYFLRQYAKHIEPVAETYAYCLLPNHFHFLIRTFSEEEQLARAKSSEVSETSELSLTEPLEPSQAFANFLNGYVRAFNRRHERTGGLFEGRLGRKPITSDRHYSHLVVYIHRNPQAHGLIDDFREWPFSSYSAIRSNNLTRIQRAAVLDWFGNRDAFAAAHSIEPDERLIAHLVAADFV